MEQSSELVMGLICNTCLDSPTDAVVSSCGHLFCWPCLHQWLQDRPKPCPVCRHVLRRDINIIPIYAGDAAAGPATDGTIIPPRPHPPSSAGMGLAGRPRAVHQAAFDMQLDEAHHGLRSELLADLDYERARVTALQLERNNMEEELMAMRIERTDLQRHELELVRRNIVMVRELAETRRRRDTQLRL